MATTLAQPDLMTMGEAAASLGVHRNTLRRWIASGRVPAYRVGPRLVRLHPADLARLAAPVLPSGAAR